MINRNKKHLLPETQKTQQTQNHNKNHSKLRKQPQMNKRQRRNQKNRHRNRQQNNIHLKLVQLINSLRMEREKSLHNYGIVLFLYFYEEKKKKEKNKKIKYFKIKQNIHEMFYANFASLYLKKKATVIYI